MHSCFWSLNLKLAASSTAYSDGQLQSTAYIIYPYQALINTYLTCPVAPFRIAVIKRRADIVQYCMTVTMTAQLRNDMQCRQLSSLLSADV